MQLDWLREMESERGVYRVMSSREAQLLVVGECSSSSQEEGGMRGRGTCPILIPKLTERIKEILRRRRLPFSYYCTRSVFIFIYVQYVRIKSKRHHIGSIPPSPTQPQKKEEKKRHFFFFPLPDKLLHCKSNSRTQAVGPIGESSSGRKDFITPKQDHKKKLDHHRNKSSCTESMIDIPTPCIFYRELYISEKGEEAIVDGQQRKKNVQPKVL